MTERGGMGGGWGGGLGGSRGKDICVLITDTVVSAETNTRL